MSRGLGRSPEFLVEMIAAPRADVQPKALAGLGGNEFEDSPRAAQRDSAEAGGSGGQRVWLALSLDDQPSLYQFGRWELFMTMAQPGRFVRETTHSGMLQFGHRCSRGVSPSTAFAAVIGAASSVFSRTRHSVM